MQAKVIWSSYTTCLGGLGWLGMGLLDEIKAKGRFQKNKKQAGTELGQAQLKLGLNFTQIFCRFGFFPFGLMELIWLGLVPS